MTDLQSILSRYPSAVCPVDATPEALEALAHVLIQLRPLVALTTPDGRMLSSTFDGTQGTLVLYSTPQKADVQEDRLGVRWLWEG